LYFKELLMDAFFKIWLTFSNWLIDNAIILGTVAALIAIVGGLFAVIKWFARGEPKDDSGADDPSSNNIEIRVGGDNTGIINAGEGTVITAGDNATIAVGYTIEKHEAILKSRETQLRQDLTAASTAEKQVIQLQLDSVEKELVDLTASYEAAVQENVRLKSELAAFAEYIPGDEITRAQSALENGDRSTADAILKSAEERSQNVVRDSARMAYLRGEIAEGEIRLQDALDHYERAYGQYPTFDHLGAYARLCREMGRWRDAVPLQQNILKQVAQDSGKQGAEYAEALNNLAVVLKNLGEYTQAEPLYEQALDISRRVLGDDHPDTARSLHNLALFYEEQGHFAQAEPLYIEAVEIAERVLVGEHPNTKIIRKNYEGLLA
jgi:tetratricopeptide (TPR) repeat protein